MAIQRQVLKLALPKGRLLPATTRLLARIGLDFADYTESTRMYHYRSARYPNLAAKMFQEKDIPIQVAVGNYDLGICGLDWVEELMARYPASAVLKIADLGYGRAQVYAATSRYGGAAGLRQLSSLDTPVRLVSEYPNLAESFALNLRLRRFKVFPVWGAAEVYPPESGDVVIVRDQDEASISSRGLVPLSNLLPVSAFLIANSESWECRDLSDVLACFRGGPFPDLEAAMPAPAPNGNGKEPVWRPDTVWLALPDGHQQDPTIEFLKKAGLHFPGYSDGKKEKRISTDEIDIKVIRPQDMPMQVANGNFDLAFTGRDWLSDQLFRFPSSPVKEVVRLDSGKVRIVAAMSQSLGIKDLAGLRRLLAEGRFNPLRVCSEYVNITDRYMWDNHLSPYKLVPTWGASEAFLPDDADLLIENTQTGSTLARQKLDIIDTLFESTGCIIGSPSQPPSPLKRQRIASLLDRFRQAAGV